MNGLDLDFASPGWKPFLDAAFRFWKAHIRLFFPPLFLLLLVAYIPLRIVQFRQINMMTKPPDIAEILPWMAGMLLGVAFYMLVYGFSYFFACALILDRLSGGAGSWKKAFGRALRLRNLLTMILMGLAVGIGFIFCFLPGLYLLLIWGLFVPAMLDEGSFGTDAFRRSAQLLKHNPQKRFTSSPAFLFGMALLAAWMIQGALQYLISMPLMAFGLVYALQNPDPAHFMAVQTSLQFLGVSLVLEMFMLAMRAVYLILVLTLVVFFYHRTKNVREGHDLEAMLVRRLA